MHTAHIVQLLLFVLAVFLMVGAWRIGTSANAQGDGAVGSAVIALIVGGLGIVLFLIVALWFVIGGILGF